jgi:hypothetical protein
MYPSMGHEIVIMAEVPLAVTMVTVVAEATKAAPIGAIATTATAPGQCVCPEGTIGAHVCPQD